MKDPELVEDETDEETAVEEIDLPEYDPKEFEALDDLYYVGGNSG